MPSFLDRVCDQLNLRWAWEKVKKASVPGDVWIDEAALASFEVHLNSELQQLASDLRSGHYRLAPLRPMAFPKNPDAEGNPRVRQYFNFSIRDQVAWIAVVNIVGSYVDEKMPTWSYGNRLYRSMWIEETEQGGRERRVGPYRHSSGKIYRPFHQAWPVFRRHIALAVAAATAAQTDLQNLDQEELEELEFQRASKLQSRCPYVFKDYWTWSRNDCNDREIYWASVDLEKFYPSIRISACVEKIVSCLPDSMRQEADRVLKRLSRFPLDLDGWSDEDLRHIDLDKNRKYFHRIPTGLLVSGFLANAALLTVDQEVERVLPRGKIAHFRYVDDHVILAKSLEDLVLWLSKYHEILKNLGSGAHVNPSKTEPSELGALLVTIADSGKLPPPNSEQWQKISKVCRLDPDFPTPLMTKTIALVSAIGRTDFTALEDEELSTLTQQLEHLLLVDLPETEMPERTRLAFAATRLARVAEARLAAPETLTDRLAARRSSNPQQDLLTLADDSLHFQDPLVKLSGLKRLDDQRLLKGIANRVFSLVRRVLRDRPDRVRLWTHALVIARRLGASGINDLFSDIVRYGNNPINGLAQHYLLGNSYAVLATQAVLAAELLANEEAAGWRRSAALRFLRDLSSFTKTQFCSVDKSQPWFVEQSFKQFCVGVYCAEYILRVGNIPAADWGMAFANNVLSKGLSCLSGDTEPSKGRVALAWWGARFDMRAPVRHASNLVLHLGGLIQALDEAQDFWTFFPSDAPAQVLEGIAVTTVSKRTRTPREGWWFDALHGRQQSQSLGNVTCMSSAALRIQRALQYFETSLSVPLPLWTASIWHRIDNREIEAWRVGEWTCLEIVRQAAELLAEEKIFDRSYIERASSRAKATPCAHPFNFVLPIQLVTANAVSWQEWRSLLRPNGGRVVRLSPEKYQLDDYRYSPLVANPLGPSQNPIRGIGLTLFGLLARSFLLPVQWNGPGHETLLKHLPQLLRDKVTYSSLTLGVLDACLQPRANENIFADLYGAWHGEYDKDTLSDPVILLGPQDLANAISVAQAELEKNQMSTLNHRPRQLTPVNLMHLTDANWRGYFEEVDS